MHSLWVHTSGTGLFHLAHRRMPTKTSLSAEWGQRAPRPPLWALYTKILHTELASTAFCFTPISLGPVTAWHLQLRAFEETASAREMRHAHLVLRAILLPPGPGPFKAHGNILQPFTLSQKRGGGIQSQIKAICHASIPKQQGQSTPHHAACPASSDGVQLDSGNRLSLSFHS